MFRKVVSVLMLTVIILGNSYIYPRQEAEAFVPLLVPAALYAPIACAIIAAGVSFASKTAIDSAVQWWYSNASTDMRNQAAADAATLTNGVMTISDSLWSNIISWTRANFVQGSNTVAYTVDAVNVLDFEYTTSAMVAGTYYIYTMANGVSVEMYYHKGANQLQYYEFVNGNYKSMYADVFTNYSKYKFVADGTSIDCKVFNTASGLWETLHAEANQIAVQGSELINLAYIGASVLGLGTYDFGNGERKVNVPATTDDLVNKTYTDTQWAPPPDPATIIPAVPGSLTAVPGDNSISLDWSKVPGADSYNLYVAGVLYMTGILGTHYLLQGLTDGTSYDVGISGVNTIGEGAQAHSQAVPKAVAQATGVAAAVSAVYAVAMTKVPFAWIGAWSTYSTQAAGSDKFLFSWQPGLDPSQVISLGFDDSVGNYIRPISTLILSGVIIWVAYFEIRRFVG